MKNKKILSVLMNVYEEALHDEMSLKKELGDEYLAGRRSMAGAILALFNCKIEEEKKLRLDEDAWEEANELLKKGSL